MIHTTIATQDGPPTTLPEEAVEEFRDRLRGPLLSPADADFETRLVSGTG